MKKNTLFVIVLVLIGAAIWYLESIKPHPAVLEGGQGSAQDIAISSDVTSTVPAGTDQSPSSPARNITLRSIAQTDKEQGYRSAVELAGPTGFVNAQPFRLADLVGKKVVLFDFWTYSCINGIRTLPHLTSLYAKYRDQGLE